MTLDSLNAFTVTVALQSVLWKYNKQNKTKNNNKKTEVTKVLNHSLDDESCLITTRQPPTLHFIPTKHQRLAVNNLKLAVYYCHPGARQSSFLHAHYTET